jgi:hypothetical protein
MKASGPRHERETVIVFNEEEGFASIWTASQQVYKKLLRRGYALESDNERSASFKVSKRLITFRGFPEGAKPRRTLTPEHKAKLREGRFKLSGITQVKELIAEVPEARA